MRNKIIRGRKGMNDIMENCGVCCNVHECMYHAGNDKCSLDKIHVTHEKTGADSVSVPHFCKSYEKK